MRTRGSPTVPCRSSPAGGARIVLNVNGSPFRTGKQAGAGTGHRRPGVRVGCPGRLRQPRRRAGRARVRRRLVRRRRVRSTAPRWWLVASSSPQGVFVFDVELPPERHTLDRYRSIPVTGAAGCPSEPVFAVAPPSEPLDELGEQWGALVLATRDYVRKSGFTDVAVALSGGVDSSITAAVAVDALGADHVHGVLDAVALLERSLGVGCRGAGGQPRDGDAADSDRARSCRPHRDARCPTWPTGRIDTGDLTDQNVQSRIRGMVMMGLANEHNWLVLTTGNKSEAAVGYSTLYGDTAGAYAVIKDVWKLTVYDLCRWRNEQGDKCADPTRRRADEASFGGVAPRPARRSVAASPTTCWTRSCGRMSNTTAPSRRSRRWASPTTPRSSGYVASSTSPSTSAVRRRLGARLTRQGVRPRPPHADHQPLPRLMRGHSDRSRG